MKLIYSVLDIENNEKLNIIRHSPYSISASCFINKLKLNYILQTPCNTCSLICAIEQSWIVRNVECGMWNVENMG